MPNAPIPIPIPIPIPVRDNGLLLSKDVSPCGPCGPCGLAQLDDRVLTRKTGVVLAVTTNQATAHAVRQHVIRRVGRQSERMVLTAKVGHLDSCFGDVALRLGIPRLSGDPREAGCQLAEASDGALVVMQGDLEDGSWDAQVLAHLPSTDCRGLFVLVCTETGRMIGRSAHENVIEIRGESRETARIWWKGVIETLVEAGPPGSLASLERWWRGMGGIQSQPYPVEASLEDSAHGLLRALVLVRHCWPVASIEALGTRQDLDVLVQSGFLRVEQGFVVVDRPEQVLIDVAVEEREQFARALIEVFGDDPWCRLRGASLLLSAGLLRESDSQLAQALAQAGSVSLRQALWSIWSRELSALDPESHRDMAIRSARRALELEDVDAALALAGEAQRGLPQPVFEACLLMGKAQLARGDIVGAKVSLAKSRELAPDETSRAEALASEAEAAFWAGELELASDLAEQAVACCPAASARLGARNVLGRILLARAQWNEAESSFAEDELFAASEQLVDALSRARVNRAIALLSKGQLDLARHTLEAVLEEGRRQQHPRAIAIALSNLGVVAHLDGRYAQALELYKQAIDSCRDLGDRLGLARPAANLSELRLELGLVDEAEQALRFARNMLSAGVPASIAPLLSVLDAEIALERGDSARAIRCARDGLANASRSSNGTKVGECHRLIARIALEDGNLSTAEDAIARSQKHAESDRAEAECVWLEARLVRAKGDDATDLARQATFLARSTGDRELCRSTSMLEAEIALSEDDLRAAESHLHSAQHMLREMTDGLPPALEKSLRSRREIQGMESLAFILEQRKGTVSLQASASASEHAKRGESVGFVGKDPKIVRLMSMVQRVASNSNAPVLISGESGTGKELIAEAIHRFSDRQDKPLIKVNCAALVETLLLSELFGHEKGAFTGASSRRRGRFELADGGVLFLDEIGDISPRTQVALLRVLQDGTFERVGGGSPIKTDVRVVCATHRDLSRMVADGKFREDLYYRLCGVVLEVPPLRERGQDLVQLANHFLIEIGRERNEPVRTLSVEAIEVITQHTWPGNVRELQNVLRAATLFADGLVIEANVVIDQMHTPGTEELEPVSSSGPRSGPRSRAPSDPSTLAFESIRQGETSLMELKRHIERECIVRALSETGGNITRAATLLGMKRPRLSQIIKELGLQKGEG